MRVSRRLLSGEKHKSLQSCSIWAGSCILTGCCSLHLFEYNVSGYVYGRRHGRAATSFLSSNARGGQHIPHSILALAQGES